MKIEENQVFLGLDENIEDCKCGDILKSKYATLKDSEGNVIGETTIVWIDI